MILNTRDIRLVVCFPCPYRKGTQDDPLYPNTFCEQWYPACPHIKNQAAKAFSIDDTGDEVKIPDLGVTIPKKIVEEYINHIIDRLRMRQIPQWQQDNLLLRVRELENTRRFLHNAIKNHLGIDAHATDTTTVTIEVLMEHYVEARAKRFA